MSDDRVATARGLADQLFEADLRGRKLIERTGELALEAWQAFAVEKGNRGLYAVLEQCDRCAFAERWRELATIYAERGKPGVFAALAPAAPPAGGGGGPGRARGPPRGRSGVTGMGPSRPAQRRRAR